jgi:guanine nucleotide-binding protein alpha-1 subunit
MYKPESIEEERVSWRAVVYFNIVRTIKHILSTIEDSGDRGGDDTGSPRQEEEELPPLAIVAGLDSNPDMSFAEHPSSPTEPSMDISLLSPKLVHTTADASSSSAPAPDSEAYQIATLRLRLSPLIAADAQLADLLSGGVTVAGSGKGGVYVRSGWQTRTANQTIYRGRRSKRSPTPPRENGNTVLGEIRRMLDACKYDIKALWEHPQVKTLIAKRRLRLEEWSE